MNDPANERAHRLQKQQDGEALGREHPIRGLGFRRRLRRGGDASRPPARTEGWTEGSPAFHAGRAGGPGQGSTQRVAALGSCRLGAGASAPRPGRSARGAGADASAGARPDPVRAHARVAVHLLPRRRVPDGGRSRGRAADGIARSTVRRRAPLQLRHFRGAGSEARLQHQRLRRDAAGAIRVGREAACCKLRGRGPRARLERCRSAVRSS